MATGALVPFTVRGALQSEDGTVTAVAAQLRGHVKEIDFGTWKPGEKVPMKAMVSVRYYKLEHAGNAIHEIDVAAVRAFLVPQLDVRAVRALVAHVLHQPLDALDGLDVAELADLYEDARTVAKAIYGR